MRLRVLTLCLDWRRESFHSMSVNWRIHVIYITQGRKQWPQCIWCLIFAVNRTAFRVTKEIPLAVPLRGLPESFNWREESHWMLVYHSMVWGPGQNQRKKIYICKSIDFMSSTSKHQKHSSHRESNYKIQLQPSQIQQSSAKAKLQASHDLTWKIHYKTIFTKIGC